jgi:hypothetical protein
MENHFLKKFYRPSDSRVMKTLRIIGMVLVGLIFVVLFALAFGFLVKWIWNLLMPDLFGLKEITYWQAFGMVILAKLLFGAFGTRHHDHGERHPRPFPNWHGRFGRPEDYVPWNRRHKDWKYYKKYWQDEGKAAFEAYMKRIEKEKEGESGSATQE